MKSQQRMSLNRTWPVRAAHNRSTECNPVVVAFHPREGKFYITTVPSLHIMLARAHSNLTFVYLKKLIENVLKEIVKLRQLGWTISKLLYYLSHRKCSVFSLGL